MFAILAVIAPIFALICFGFGAVRYRLFPADGVKALLERAQALGLAPQLDPQIATLLAAVRLRDDVPKELYAALAAVVGTLLNATHD